MRLWKEIFTQLNDGGSFDSESVTALNYTVLEGKGGYFQNVRSLGGFTPQEIVLCLRKGTVKVAGENLTVAKYCENDVFVKGDIRSVTREGI